MNNIILSFDDCKAFIKNYGLDMYDNCPCGSQIKYKFCCYKNKNSFVPSELKARVSEMNKMFNRNNWELKKCIHNNCGAKSQRCHSIQNNRFLSQLCNQDKKIYHFHQIFFQTITGLNIKIKIDCETIDIASTFNLLCNHHDSKIFEIIEKNNIIIFNDEQKYSLIYRNILYMYAKKIVMNQFIIPQILATQAKYLDKKFIPKNQYECDLAVNSLIDIIKHKNTTENLLDIIKEIGVNYNNNSEKWQIVNNSLLFTNIRTLKVKDADICFQTVREYLFNDRNSYPTDFFKLLEEDRKNFIATIVLPNKSNNTLTIFFAVYKNSKNDMSSFVNKINNSTDVELINITNNIILDAYEELYFSENKFDTNTVANITDYIQTNIDKNNPLFYESLFENAKFNFIKVY